MDTTEILAALKERNIPEEHLQEAASIVLERMRIKNCLLDEAVDFVITWIKRQPPSLPMG